MTRLAFIHGLGDDSTVWNTTISQPVLSTFEIQTVEVPGFGGRPWHGESLEEIAEILWNEIESGEPTVVIGHSMGGVIAALIAEATPVSLVGMVSVEGNLTFAGTFLSKRAIEADDFDSWFSYLKGKWVGRYGDALGRCDPKAFLAMARQLVALSVNDDLARRYRALALSKLYVHGTEKTVPESLLALEGQRKVQVDGGHWVMETNPDVLAREIASFIRESIDREQS